MDGKLPLTGTGETPDGIEEVAATGGTGVEPTVGAGTSDVGEMGTEVGCMGEAVLSGLTPLAFDEMGTDDDCMGEAAMSGLTSLEGGGFLFCFLRIFWEEGGPTAPVSRQRS